MKKALLLFLTTACLMLAMGTEAGAFFPRRNNQFNLFINSGFGLPAPVVSSNQFFQSSQSFQGNFGGGGYSNSQFNQSFSSSGFNSGFNGGLGGGAVTTVDGFGVQRTFVNGRLVRKVGPNGLPLFGF